MTSHYDQGIPYPPFLECSTSCPPTKRRRTEPSFVLHPYTPPDPSSFLWLQSDLQLVTMPYRMAALLLFLVFFPRLTIAYVHEGVHERESRTVTNTSKAGLPWPNGNFVDINQYLKTGKVQWSVPPLFSKSNVGH